ncbi:hypothetical protein PV10_05095 [Exophiala mesophila]|uniref:Major facilitator superfamily (MFS) profile domain-containing protein n=1 Tax=Exophiala mesophila TaxID=212818 RepID=A0A0D1Y098_EXOME|nr:uncharacterized protein PV10_05095 [Exophiala mesophila]KIV93921.1 hypothetical protein PV10_05095 [Exophiala mesophila]
MTLERKMSTSKQEYELPSSKRSSQRVEEFDPPVDLKATPPMFHQSAAPVEGDPTDDGTHKLNFQIIASIIVRTSTAAKYLIDLEMLTSKQQALTFTYEASLLTYILPISVLLTINADIGPASQLSWVAISSSLSAAVVQTIAGRCSDIFGRRNFYLAGNLLGLTGIVNPLKTLIARAVGGQGIASAFQTLAFAAACEIVPKRYRGLTVACINIAAIPGSAFGAVIAYAMVATLSWRWTFYIPIIANGIAFILIALFYFPPDFKNLHPDGKSRSQQVKELDYLGLLLLGGGLASLLIGISFGDNPHSWTSAPVLTPLIIGAVTVTVAFPAWEIYSPCWITKLCPPEIFKEIRGFTLPLVVTFVSGMMFTALAVLWPQEVTRLFTTTPRTIGWYSLAYNLSATGKSSPMGGFVCGVLFSTIGKAKWQFVVATFLQTAFVASISTVTQHTPARAIALVSIAALSIGASQLSALLITQLGVPDEHIGVATGLTACVRSTGGAVAVAVYSSVMQSSVAKHLVPDVAAAVVQAGLPVEEVESFIVALTSGSLGEFAVSVTPAIIAAGIDAMQTVFSNAFRQIYLVSIAFGCVSCFAVVFIRDIDHKLTMHTATRLRGNFFSELTKDKVMVTAANEKSVSARSADV